jgi:hypothetical protein
MRTRLRLTNSVAMLEHRVVCVQPAPARQAERLLEIFVENIVRCLIGSLICITPALATAGRL